MQNYYALEPNRKMSEMSTFSFIVVSTVHAVCGSNSKEEKSIKHSKGLPRHLQGIKNLDPKGLVMKERVDREMGMTFFLLFFIHITL